MKPFLRTIQLFVVFFILFYAGIRAWIVYAPTAAARVPASGIVVMSVILSLAVTLLWVGS